MGFFDVTNDIPIELIFKGEESKNNEIKALENYILNNKNKLNNTIFVLDRAYCSYKFIEFCFKNKIKYVIRFRNNCNNIPENNRIIKFNHYINETVKNDNIDKHLINNKKFESVTLKTKNEYTLITNINLNDYNDEQIKEIYHRRWNIEVFFKILKFNFKFSDLKITNVEQNNEIYSIHNIKILIIYLLAKIMEKIHYDIEKIKLIDIIKKRNIKNKRIKKENISKKITEKNKTINKKIINNSIINVNISNNKQIIIEEKTKKKKSQNEDIKLKNKDRECILKSCMTNIIKGVFESLHEIINGKLIVKSYSNIANQYIKYYKIDKLINNKRVCKTPFKKWYIKGYTNKSDSIKIVNYILGFSETKLNKNLMIKLKNSKIIIINYINET